MNPLVAFQLDRILREHPNAFALHEPAYPNISVSLTRAMNRELDLATAQLYQDDEIPTVWKWLHPNFDPKRYQVIDVRFETNTRRRTGDREVNIKIPSLCEYFALYSLSALSLDSAMTDSIRKFPDSFKEYFDENPAQFLRYYLYDREADQLVRFNPSKLRQNIRNFLNDPQGTYTPVDLGINTARIPQVLPPEDDTEQRNTFLTELYETDTREATQQEKDDWAYAKEYLSVVYPSSAINEFKGLVAPEVSQAMDAYLLPDEFDTRRTNESSRLVDSEEEPVLILDDTNSDGEFVFDPTEEDDPGMDSEDSEGPRYTQPPPQQDKKPGLLSKVGNFIKGVAQTASHLVPKEEETLLSDEGLTPPVTRPRPPQFYDYAPEYDYPEHAQPQLQSTRARSTGPAPSPTLVPPTSTAPRAASRPARKMFNARHLMGRPPDAASADGAMKVRSEDTPSADGAMKVQTVRSTSRSTGPTFAELEARDRAKMHALLEELQRDNELARQERAERERAELAALQSTAGTVQDQPLTMSALAPDPLTQQVMQQAFDHLVAPPPVQPQFYPIEQPIPVAQTMPPPVADPQFTLTAPPVMPTPPVAQAVSAPPCRLTESTLELTEPNSEQSQPEAPATHRLPPDSVLGGLPPDSASEIARASVLASHPDHRRDTQDCSNPIVASIRPSELSVNAPQEITRDVQTDAPTAVPQKPKPIEDPFADAVQIARSEGVGSNFADSQRAREEAYTAEIENIDRMYPLKEALSYSAVDADSDDNDESQVEDVPKAPAKLSIERYLEKRRAAYYREHPHQRRFFFPDPSESEEDPDDWVTDEIRERLSKIEAHEVDIEKPGEEKGHLAPKPKQLVIKMNSINRLKGTPTHATYLIPQEDLELFDKEASYRLKAEFNFETPFLLGGFEEVQLEILIGNTIISPKVSRTDDDQPTFGISVDGDLKGALVGQDVRNPLYGVRGSYRSFSQYARTLVSILNAYASPTLRKYLTDEFKSYIDSILKPEQPEPEAPDPTDELLKIEFIKFRFDEQLARTAGILKLSVNTFAFPETLPVLRELSISYRLSFSPALAKVLGEPSADFFVRQTRFKKPDPLIRELNIQCTLPVDENPVCHRYRKIQLLTTLHNVKYQTRYVAINNMSSPKLFNPGVSLPFDIIFLDKQYQEFPIEDEYDFTLVLTPT